MGARSSRGLGAGTRDLGGGRRRQIENIERLAASARSTAARDGGRQIDGIEIECRCGVTPSRARAAVAFATRSRQILQAEGVAVIPAGR